MKINNKPFHLIQVFKNSYEYDKEYKTYDTRKEFVQWKQEVYSESQVEENLVVSPSSYEKRIGVLDNLIILLDNNFYTYEDYLNLLKLKNQYDDNDELNKHNYSQQKKERKPLIFGTLNQQLFDLEIFKIRSKENIELFINWDYWGVGTPKRENFKIAELKKNKAINIKVDGKRDFSMTGRRKRTFIENNYILEYKGLFEEAEVLKEEISFMKAIPKNCKEINLMQYLK